MFFGAKMPIILPQLFPSLIWKKSTIEKKVWLTFDDGPTPKITPFVLDTLLFYNVKATFFCLGKQVLKHPEILQRIKAEGQRESEGKSRIPSAFQTTYPKLISGKRGGTGKDKPVYEMTTKTYKVPKILE